MKTLALKEIRLLLPAWTGAVLLAIGMLCLFQEDAANGYAPVYIFAMGALLLALTSFGREFNLNTFSGTLAQPVERTQIWRTKMSILVLATAGIWLLWFGILFFLVPKALSPGVVIAGLIAAPVAFSSGLWSSLLVRQIVGAFWFALLVPCLLMMIVNAANASSVAMGVVLLSYSIAGYWWARQLFLTAQETGWASGWVLGPAWRWAPKNAVPTRRTQRRFPALLRKELRLQQTTLIAMAWLFLLHLVALAIRKFTGESGLNGNLRYTLEMFGGLWLLVPVISGALAIAEERKLGTLQSQVCLPVSTGVQLALKLGLVLLISACLNALLVWGLESTGKLIGAGGGVMGMKTAFAPRELAEGLLLLTLLGLAGFYGSSIAANIVQALVIALGTAVALAILLSISSELSVISGIMVWSKGLFFLVAWPIVLLTAGWLTIRNYRATSDSAGMLQRNVSGWWLALVVTALLSVSIYHRAWELLTPLEPAPGTARITSVPGSKVMEAQQGTILVQTGDGVWQGQPTFYPSFSIMKRHRVSLEGSFQSELKDNLVVLGGSETLIIRPDGTLWTLKHYGGREMQQVGKENDWKAAARENSSSVILLKNDGTLWRLGKHDYVPKPGLRWPGLASFPPEQLGSDEDWDRLMQGGDAIFAWRKNGQAWTLRSLKIIREKRIELAPGLGQFRVPVLDNSRWLDVAAFSQNVYRYCLGVRENGELWVERSSWSVTSEEIRGQKRQFDESLRLGSDTDWVSVAGNVSIVAALKRDGSLWWIDLDKNGRFMTQARALKDIRISRLGSRTDWLDVESQNGLVTLSADGSVWMWNPREISPYQRDWWLRPSRKPMLTGNIFAASSPGR